MTSQRAQAYGRVLATIEDMSAAKLFKLEQQRIRDAADTLLFSETIGAPGADQAIQDIEALTRHLIDADRWTEERAHRLADDVAGCGPVIQYA